MNAHGAGSPGSLQNGSSSPVAVVHAHAPGSWIGGSSLDVGSFQASSILLTEDMDPSSPSDMTRSRSQKFPTVMLPTSPSSSALLIPSPHLLTPSSSCASPFTPVAVITTTSSATATALPLTPIVSGASLLSPSNATLTEEQRKVIQRKRVAEELLSTEETFVDNLHILCDVFIGPLEQKEKKFPRIVHDPRLAVFFSSIKQLFALNAKLASDLQMRVKNVNDTQILGDLFRSYAPYFKMYGQYARDHEECVQMIQNYAKTDSNFAEFLRTFQADPETKCQTLESLLICPVQRVPRYTLLIGEIIKLTPTDHADLPALNRAAVDLKEAGLSINETIRRREARDILVALDSKFGNKLNLASVEGRILIKEGPMTRMTARRGGKLYYFHLLSDVLLYSDETLTDRYTLHRMMDLRSMKVSSVEPLPAKVQHKLGRDVQPDKYEIAISAAGKSFKCQCNTAQEKMDWLAAFEKASSELSQGTRKRMQSTFVAAPVWEQTATSCAVCQQNFNLVTRKHHCRQCGGLVCAGCSNNKRILKHIHESTPMRICDNCDKEQPNSPVRGSFRPEDGLIRRSSQIDQRLSTTTNASATSESGLGGGAGGGHSESDDDDDEEKNADGSITTTTTATADQMRMLKRQEQVKSEKHITLLQSDSRYAIAFELLEQEEAYIADMLTLLELFVKPTLRTVKYTQKGLIKSGSTTVHGETLTSSQQSSLLIFLNNIEPLLTVNQELLSDLDGRINPETWSSDTLVGDILYRTGPLLSLYSQYAISQSRASQVIATHLGSAVAEYERLQGKKLDYFLSLPMMRLGHYVWGCQRLLQATPPSHLDHQNCDLAHAAIQEQQQKFNTNLIEAHLIRHITEIEVKFSPPLELTAPGRIFLKEGYLTRHTRRGEKKFYFHLFTGVLLYSAVSKANGKYTLHKRIELDTAKIEDMSGLFVRILSSVKSFEVRFETESEKRVWVKKLNEARAQDEKESGAVAPVWTGDKSSGACVLCASKFSVFSRRHHCRNCGKIVCAKCSSTSRQLAVSTKAVRVCDACKE